MSIAEGEAWRDEALDRVASTEERRAYIALAQQAAKIIAEMEGEVCSDDVVKACPPPNGWDHRIIGAVFRKSKDSPFEFVRYERTKRAQGHARPMAIWKLKDD